MFLRSLSTADLDKMFRHSIGLSDLLDNLETIFNEKEFHYSLTQNYPPHNIRKVDNKFLIELAIAGFSQEEISITQEKHILSVEGTKADKSDNFLYKGIANRNFKKSFALGDNMKVLGAEVKNGMLYVVIEQIVPEEDKPKKIEIGSVKNLLE